MNESGRPGRGGEFFTLLEELRMFRAGPLAGDPSDRALARAAGASPTTIGVWLRGERFPQDIGPVLVMVQMVREAAARRGVAIPDGGPAGLLDKGRWQAAYRQEARRRAGVVSGGVEHAQAVWALAGPRVRVGDASLRLLGVHAAISVPGVPDEVPPEYVLRDVDAAEFGVRAKVKEAAQWGGVHPAGRRVFGWQDPVCGGGGQGTAAGLVAGISARASGGHRPGPGATAADGGVAG